MVMATARNPPLRDQMSRRSLRRRITTRWSLPLPSHFFRGQRFLYLSIFNDLSGPHEDDSVRHVRYGRVMGHKDDRCLLYTSDAADDLLCVDLGGRRIIK